MKMMLEIAILSLLIIASILFLIYVPIGGIRPESDELARLEVGEEYHPDVWYDANQLAIVGTASWIFFLIVAAYFMLKWRKNTEKFYKTWRERYGSRGHGGEQR